MPLDNSSPASAFRKATRRCLPARPLVRGLSPSTTISVCVTRPPITPPSPDPMSRSEQDPLRPGGPGRTPGASSPFGTSPLPVAGVDASGLHPSPLVATQAGGRSTSSPTASLGAQAQEQCRSRSERPHCRRGTLRTDIFIPLRLDLVITNAFLHLLPLALCKSKNTIEMGARKGANLKSTLRLIYIKGFCFLNGSH